MKKIMIKLLKFYQNKISPLRPGKCRYIPTCSNYAIECYMNFNFFKATFLTIKRVLKCNPFFKVKYDPVPINKKKSTNNEISDIK